MNNEKIIAWLSETEKSEKNTFEWYAPGTLGRMKSAGRLSLADDIRNFIQSEPEETCTYDLWDEDSNTYKCSTCGAVWTLNADNPKENNMSFCPECGRKIVEKAGE